MIAAKALQLGQHDRIRLAVGGTQPHIHTIRLPHFLQVKRPRPMRHAHQQQRFIFHGNRLDLGHHRGHNAVGDQAGQPLLFSQDIIHPDNRPIIRSTDNQRSASRIGKSHQRAQHRLR